MADSKISALPTATTPLAGTEVLPVVQGGVTDQVSVANLTAGRAVSVASITLSTGSVTPSTAGKGVNFTANTPAAGMTSQELGWYEQGTWTPSVGGNATYTTQAGTYTRIGRMVFITGRLTINVIGTGSTSVISGLPFTSANTSDTGKGTVGYFSGLASNVVYLAIDTNANATTLKFASLAAAGATATSGGALLTSGTRVDFSLCYTAA